MAMNRGQRTTGIQGKAVLQSLREEYTIDTCVASLLAQDYPDFDVTLIDDGSTDATPRLLTE